MRPHDRTTRLVGWILRGHVWLIATALPLLVKLFSLQALLNAFAPPPWFRPYGWLTEREIAGAVRRRLRTPKVMKRRACLREGLLLFHFLRLAGLPAELRIGAYAPEPASPRMHAHCWITVGGRSISNAPESPVALLVTHTGGQIL